jgi:hypothetical protein
MRPFFRRATKNNEALKQDQSCILAQNFSSCRKLRLEVVRETLFITATHSLSSTARVNAARYVHSGTKTQLQKNKFVQKNRTRDEKKFASTAAKPKEKEKLRPQTQLVNGENQADIAVQERRFNAAFTLHRA